MCRARIAVLLLALAALPAGAGARPASGRDPASVDGTWDYRTRSNCGSVEGLGEVAFAWNDQTLVYDERGFVHWSDSGHTIRWWGTASFEPRTRRLVARVRNSLGDDVSSTWQLEGQGPDRLVVRWTQTNGCVGVGIATRRP
jgi:hypothetical protein